MEFKLSVKLGHVYARLRLDWTAVLLVELSESLINRQLIMSRLSYHSCMPIHTLMLVSLQNVMTGSQYSEARYKTNSHSPLPLVDDRNCDAATLLCRVTVQALSGRRFCSLFSWTWVPSTQCTSSLLTPMSICSTCRLKSLSAARNLRRELPTSTNITPLQFTGLLSHVVSDHRCLML